MSTGAQSSRKSWTLTNCERREGCNGAPLNYPHTTDKKETEMAQSEKSEQDFRTKLATFLAQVADARKNGQNAS